MTNANKAKGTAYETAVQRYLAEKFDRFAEVVKPRQSSWTDVGDIHVVPVGVVLQAKNVAAHDFSGWLRDVESQRAAAGATYGVVVAKRRGRPVAESYVVMTLEQFRSMLDELRSK